MSLQNAINLPFPRPFKTLADAEDYAKQLRRNIHDWTSTLPNHVDIVTLGLSTLSDPNDDRIMFWDDSAGKLAWLDPGNSVAITATTIDTIQDIRTTAGPSFDHAHLTVATGTAPLGITSTTMSPNLNADLLDGYHASAFPLADGTAMTKAVTQATHGLSVGDVVKCTAANTYAKAQADSAANAEVVGIVASSADGDNFVLLMGGYWASASVPAQAAGTVMFLSPTSAGAMTATAPTTDGQVSKPIGVIVESGAKMLIFNWRGVILDTWELLGLEDLTDPGADRIFFWDDGAGKSDWLACGNSVSITDTTLDTIQDIRTSAGPTFDHLHLTDELFLADTVGAEIGVIYKGGTKWAHNYYAAGSDGYNIFVGKNAGNFTLGPGGGGGWLGSYNTGIGTDALKSLTTGYGNVAVGDRILDAVTEGFHNVGLGSEALTDITTGTYNIGIGNQAGKAITNGSYNTVVGMQAMPTATSAYGNFAFGYQSLYSLTNGQNNVAMGAYAGYSITSGNLGLFLGYKAGYYETATDKLYLDNRQRASEADGRAKALIYGIFNDATASQYLNVNGHLNALEDISVAGTKVLGARVVDARCDDAINSGDATTDGVIDALRDAMIAHGLIASA